MGSGGINDIKCELTHGKCKLSRKEICVYKMHISVHVLYNTGLDSQVSVYFT